MRRALEEKSKEKNKKVKNLKPNMDKRTKMVLIVITVIIFLAIIINNYILLGLVINKNITTEDAIQVELKSSNNTLISYKNEILIYNAGVMTSYNNYGKKIWEIELEDTVEADITTAGDYIQVVNKDKGIIYIFKNKYESARIKVDGKIYSGSINKDGMSVIEYTPNGSKTVLGVYDNKGALRYNIKLSNKIIGKYVLSDDSQYLAYIDVNVHGISAYTNINLVDLSSVSKEQSNANIIHTMDNELGYDLYWDGKDIIVRFGESYMIYNVTFDKKQIVEISSGSIVNIGNYAKRYAYTQIDQTGEYVFKTKKITSENEKTVKLKNVPKYFLYEDGVIYVCYQKNIEAYNRFGVKVKNYDSDIIITEPVIFNSGRSVAMTISNKLIIFTI